eukprot:Nk52_evm48s221 gene=Nk52_evmTU48s221
MMSGTLESNNVPVQAQLKRALALDAAGASGEALALYLQCISNISAKLGDSGLSQGTKVKLLDLGRHCFDRVAFFVGGNRSEASSASVSRTCSNESADRAHSGKKSKERDIPFTTLADVRIENDKLLRTYEDRLKTLDKSAKSDVKDNLTLSLIRKCKENIAIAKSRHQKLMDKVIERQEKMLLDAEISRKQSASLNYLMHPKAYSGMDWRSKIVEYELAFSNYFRDELCNRLNATPIDLSYVELFVKRIACTFEHPICRLMTTVHHSLVLLYCSSQSSSDRPTDDGTFSYSTSSVGGRVNLNSMGMSVLPIFNTEDRYGGDGGALMEGGGEESEYVEKMQSVKNDLMRDIRSYLDALKNIVIRGYPEMGEDESVIETCKRTLEEIVFNAISHVFFKHSFRINARKEGQLCKKVQRLRKLHPKHFRIEEKLWLVQSEDEFVALSDCGAEENVPYIKAIRVLQRVSLVSHPTRKLETVSECLQLICSAVSDYFSNIDLENETPAIGAEDLVHIVAFVAANTGCKHLISECSFMEAFISGDDILGELGYCLASLQAALDHLLNLNLEST